MCQSTGAVRMLMREALLAFAHSWNYKRGKELREDRRGMEPADAGPSAEREGFEPSVHLRAHRFSRPARSAALAPLQVQIGPTGTLSRIVGWMSLADNRRCQVQTPHGLCL